MPKHDLSGSSHLLRRRPLAVMAASFRLAALLAFYPGIHHYRPPHPHIYLVALRQDRYGDNVAITLHRHCIMSAYDLKNDRSNHRLAECAEKMTNTYPWTTLYVCIPHRMTREKTPLIIKYRYSPPGFHPRLFQ